MWPDWISVLERSLWLLGWTWCVGCNVYVDGVGLARREEGRLARRLYQWLKQEKMVACAGWRGEPKFRVATWWATYSYTVVIRYCSSLKKNCSKKEVGKFPDINAWLMTTIFNVFVSVGQSLIPLEPFSFIPILSLGPGGTLQILSITLLQSQAPVQPPPAQIHPFLLWIPMAFIVNTLQFTEPLNYILLDCSVIISCLLVWPPE